MKYTLSINIEHSTFDPESYIVTPNALGVVGRIIDAFNIGIHSFNIIGSYGTGKSSFLLALEDSLVNNSHVLVANKVSLMDIVVSDSTKLLEIIYHYIAC